MSTPTDTLDRFCDAFNRGDLDAAIALYLPDAVMVAQPDQLARGTIELRTALGRFIELKATLRIQTQNVVEAGDVALCIGRWTLQGTDPSGNAITMGGESTDVLRRQPDGRWLIAVDNPWGVQILGQR